MCLDWVGDLFLFSCFFILGLTFVECLCRGFCVVREVLVVSLDVLCVLECVHAVGVVYCDLKPSNVVFTGDGYVVIVDFGLNCCFWIGHIFEHVFLVRVLYLVLE